MICEEILKSRVSCGLILKASLDEFREIKRLILEGFPGVQVVYQRSELAPLWIVKKDERGMMNESGSGR